MSREFRFVPIGEFVHEHQEQAVFLIEPYIPRGAMILLHGEAGAGKTALTWQLAECITHGQPFLGHPVVKGSVLYLDVDSPANLIRPRLKKANPSGWTLGYNFRFNILNPLDPATRSLKTWAANHEHPDVVFANTLRKSHTADDRESHVPSQVYGAFQEIFPKSAIWINHHDKKRGDPSIPRSDKDDFSGSKAWANDATVVLHLKVVQEKPTKLVVLEQTKSQVAPDPPDLKLRMVNGTHFELAKDRAAEVVEAWHATADLYADQNERLAAVEEITGLGRSSLYGYLKKAGIDYRIRGAE